MRRAKNDRNIDPFAPEAKLFKALMHPGRLAILAILRDGEECVCHMEALLGFRQAYISQQLSVLREAGLVEDRRDGWNIFYRVIEPRVYAVLEAASNVVDQAKGARGRNVAVPATVPDCRCPKCSPVPGAAGG